MQVTVKSTKVAKTGTNKSGEWELIVVTSEDNTDYTTFDKKAKHLTSGAVIDIGEPTIKEGKCSFKEFTVISEGVAPSGKAEMTPEVWAEKDRLQRVSIESQVAAKLAVELRLGGAIDDNHSLYKKALDWCSARLQAKESPPKKVTSHFQEANKKQAPETVKPPEDKIFPSEPVPEEKIPSNKRKLMEWLQSHGKAFNETWVVNKCKIEEQRLTEDPVGCYREIKMLMGWEN